MTLTKARRADVDALSSWLPAVAAAAGYENWGERALRGAVENSQAFVDADSFVAYHIGAPVPNAAQIEFLAVRPERRRLGIGGRLVLSLERELRVSADEAYLSIPARTGIALYFWLRLGYRPLLQPHWPSKLDSASVWMVRKLR